MAKLSTVYKAVLKGFTVVAYALTEDAMDGVKDENYQQSTTSSSWGV